MSDKVTVFFICASATIAIAVEVYAIWGPFG